MEIILLAVSVNIYYLWNLDHQINFNQNQCEFSNASFICISIALSVFARAKPDKK